MSVRIFPLTQADKDSAMKKAREVVEYYSDRNKRKGKRLGFAREYETQLWYVGLCAENAIRRATDGRIGEGEEYGSDWDIFIPKIGYVQVKCTREYGINPFRVIEPRSIPNPEHLVWLTYYRDSDIQKVRELTWSEVFKFPKEGQFYQVQIPTEFWDQVEK